MEKFNGSLNSKILRVKKILFEVKSKERKFYFFLLILVLLFSLFIIFGPRFIGFFGFAPTLPTSTGFPDDFSVEGDFGILVGDLNNTYNLDNVFFGVVDNSGAAGTPLIGNLTFFYNVSTISKNESLIIKGINGSIVYCNSKTDTCAPPSFNGIPGFQGIYVLNASSNTFLLIENYSQTQTSSALTKFWNLSANNFFDFVNATGFIAVRYEFNINSSGTKQKASFLIDFAPLTIHMAINSPPNATIFSPINGSVFNASETILFNGSAIDPEDGALIGDALKWFSNIDGNIGNGTNFSKALSPGSHTITLLATDSRGLNSSASININIDNATPIITPLGCAPSFGPQNSNIICNATISDDIDLAAVSAHVITPANESIAQNVSNISNNFFFNFNQTALVGNYSVVWLALDLVGNVAQANDSFTIFDSQAPEILIISPLENQTFDIDSIVPIIFNATDNTAIDTILANVTLPNATQIPLVLTQNANTFFSNFSETALLGIYTSNIFANDTNGNVNLASRNFIIVDALPPSVTIIAPTLGSIFNQSATIEISANVSDNVEIDKVFAHVTLPNGSIATQEMLSGSIFSTNFTQTLLAGNYFVLVVANDTSGNVASNSTNFTIIDTMPPSTITNLTLLSRTNSSLSVGWANPPEADFSHAILFLNGENVLNTSATNATLNNLTPGTAFLITLNTADINGNINATNVSIIAFTLHNQGVYFSSSDAFTSNLSIVGSVSGNLTNGTISSTDENITFFLNDLPLLQITAFFISCNDTSAIVDLTNLKIELNLTPQGNAISTNLNGACIADEHILFLPNSQNQGIVVCPQALSLGEVFIGCVGQLNWSFDEAIAGVIKNGIKVELINNLYKITFSSGTSGAAELLPAPTAPPPMPTSGGGGGGGSSARRKLIEEETKPIIICTENWFCTPWSACKNKTQERTCIDLNACGTTKLKPIEKRDCVLPPKIEKIVPPAPEIPVEEIPAEEVPIEEIPTKEITIEIPKPEKRIQIRKYLPIIAVIFLIISLILMLLISIKIKKALKLKRKIPFKKIWRSK